MFSSHGRFFRQSLHDGKRLEWGRIVMLQDPLVWEKLWPLPTNLLSQTFQNSKGRLLVNSPIRWDLLSCIIHLQSKKQISILFIFRFGVGRFIGRGVKPLKLCRFVSGSCWKSQISAPMMTPFIRSSFSSVRYERPVQTSSSVAVSC
jgi:hypothetical protein